MSHLAKDVGHIQRKLFFISKRYFIEAEYRQSLSTQEAYKRKIWLPAVKDLNSGTELSSASDLPNKQ